jgi:hypothetical protein
MSIILRAGFFPTKCIDPVIAPAVEGSTLKKEGAGWLVELAGGLFGVFPEHPTISETAHPKQ